MTEDTSEAARIRQHGERGGSVRLRHFLQRRLELNDAAYDTVVDYLNTRAAEVHGKETFGIVYDITRVCNLQCAHCCVNAIFSRDGRLPKFETTTSEVKSLLRRVHEYTAEQQFLNTFLIFGGGEPTLRPDFGEIADYAKELFGQSGVGVNSNGTTLTAETLLSLSPSLGFVEISVDGFEEYHNSWRDPYGNSEFSSPYRKTLELIKNAVAIDELASKLEVSSAVTKENLGDLRGFVESLGQIGVRQYSVHRAMPVGRMGALRKSIPSMKDYARLVLDISWLRKNTSFASLHLHHSLESIYSVLFLGHDIHQSKLVSGSARHSIGIDPHGNVYFDAWSIVPPFNKMAAGNLITEKRTFQEILESEESFVRVGDEITKKDLRCRGCRMNCSGGMRFNALGHYLFSKFGDDISRAELSDMTVGLSEIDPACPLYD